MPQWDVFGDKGTYFSEEHWGMDWEEDVGADGEEKTLSQGKTPQV